MDEAEKPKDPDGLGLGSGRIPSLKPTRNMAGWKIAIFIGDTSFKCVFFQCHL